jgi:glyoxylase-like metal-dependent hydrolase (beta-lactamase superfamily II)
MQTISAETLRDWLEQGKPVTIVDVRPAHERAEWFIPGSIHIDAYKKLWERDPNALGGLEVPKDKPVVTVCARGRTSAIAAEYLGARGLNAFTMEGGMRAWSLSWNTAEVPLAGTAARVIQVRRAGKGCLSYLIGADGEAAVVDPSVSPDVYAALAQKHGWKIRHVIDTHVHADHLTRAGQLARQCGATLHVPEQKRVSYSYHPLNEGDTIAVGNSQLKILRTPGHTPESICLLLDGKALFTGDTVFLRAVGRPDLHANADEARTKSRALFASLRRLFELPPDAVVLACHTSEPVPFDGKPIAGPLGEVRAHVEPLLASEDEFVNGVLSRLPPTPPNFLEVIRLNEAGSFPADPVELEAGANRCAAV